MASMSSRSTGSDRRSNQLFLKQLLEAAMLGAQPAAGPGHPSEHPSLQAAGRRQLVGSAGHRQGTQEWHSTILGASAAQEQHACQGSPPRLGHISAAHWLSGSR